MQVSSTAKLQLLSDSNLRLARETQDIRGREVYDASGQEIGEVDDLLIDEGERQVRFLRVASGGFLGMGATKFLIPVDAVTRVTDEAVHIDQTGEKIAGAPRYDPTLVDEKYLERLYGHYGYRPYWGSGYVYPTFPY